ncbi:hypothetical protein ACVWXM_009982 [Bradyrhizobium sp. GM7.3]
MTRKIEGRTDLLGEIVLGMLALARLDQKKCQPQVLRAARAGFELHRQGAPGARKRRSVRHPCEGAARQPHCWAYAKTVIPDMEALIGNIIELILAP